MTDQAAAVGLLRALLAATTADQLTVPRSALAAALVAEIPTTSAVPLSDDLLTVAQAAARLDVSVAHLYHIARDLPFTVKLGKRQLRFDPVALAAWLTARPRHHGRAA